MSKKTSRRQKDEAQSSLATFWNQPVRWFVIPREQIVDVVLDAEKATDTVSRDLALSAVQTIMNWNKESANRPTPCAGCYALFNSERRPDVYLVAVMFPRAKDRTAFAEGVCHDCADRCASFDDMRELALRRMRVTFPNARLESPGAWPRSHRG
jgi:hypothetical protein